MTITFDSLRVSFGDTVVLDQISARIGAGITALIGANGAGKSTLMKVIGTLLKPTGGTVAISGHHLRHGRSVQQARRDLGYLDQRTTFQSNYTVQEAIAYAAWLHRISATRSGEAVGRAIDRTNLGDLRKLKLGQLSGGMRQRVYIAQAIVHEPSVLLLDEPTTGLDMIQRHDLLQMVGELGESTTILLATHAIDEIVGTAQSVLILRRGRISYHGRFDELTSSQSGTTTDLISAVRRLSE